MPKKTQSYRAWQMEKLANPDRAASYLNAALQDSTESFLIALGKVAQANRISAVEALSSLVKAAGLRIDVGSGAMGGSSPLSSRFGMDISASQTVKPGPLLRTAGSGLEEFGSLYESSPMFIPGTNVWNDEGSALHGISGYC